MKFSKTTSLGRSFTIASGLQSALLVHLKNKGNNLKVICFTAAVLLLLGDVFNSVPAGLYAQNSRSSDNEPLQMVGTLKEKSISESSGLAVSHFIDDAFWTLNDSGNPSAVFLFGDHGQTLARCDLGDAQNRDWEAMSSFQRAGKRYLLIADVGDNNAQRERCELYFFEEPEFKPRKEKHFSKTLKTQKIEFQYQDGPRDCEAVACEPDGSAIYLIEKIFLQTAKREQPGVYKLTIPYSESPAQTAKSASTKSASTRSAVTQNAVPKDGLQIARRIAEFPFRGVTGMSIAPDGKRLAVRNYLNAHLLERTATDGKLPSWEETFKNAKPKVISMPLQIQGEAICFTRDSNYLIVTSEMARQPIWKVRIPTP